MNVLRAFVDWCTGPNVYRPTQWQYYKLPFLVLVVDLVLSLLVAGVFFATDIEVGYEEEYEGMLILSWLFIPYLFMISAVEEFFFRILPLTWVLRNTARKYLHVLAALATAVAFGYVHGGLTNIPLQGIGGFLYAIVFIKYAHGERYMEAGIVLIVLHTLFNGLLALGALAAGETTF
jgi:membrane protease YdiL (CAAX protease family)